ncbi:MAG: PspC domain-containing protein [Gammaproteobacteria bacterium]|nr:PspC domain-containing protein [Gammaproteobacteria bacterium]
MSEKRTWRRSRNRIVSGVCAGLADYYGVEPNFVRIFYVLTSAASVFVPGIVIYLVLWAMMPPPE